MTASALIHIHCTEKSGQDILKNFSFCVPQRKESHRGLRQQEGEYILFLIFFYYYFIRIGQFMRQEAKWESERWEGIGKDLQAGTQTRDARSATTLYVGALLPLTMFSFLHKIVL